MPPFDRCRELCWELPSFFVFFFPQLLGRLPLLADVDDGSEEQQEGDQPESSKDGGSNGTAV